MREKNTLLSQFILTLNPFTEEIIIYISVLNVYCLSRTCLHCVYGEALVKGKTVLLFQVSGGWFASMSSVK